MARIEGYPFRFEIEDNIGESIHIHYGDFRIDCTIEQFEIISEKMENILNNLFNESGFRCSDFDEIFLFDSAELWPDIEMIQYDNVQLTELLVETCDEKGVNHVVNLEQSHIYKYLNGDDSAIDKKKQINLFQKGTAKKMSNADRVSNNVNYLSRNEYKASNDFITVTSDNRILDGQHRAASMLYLFGNKEIPVRRLLFKKREIEKKQDKVLNASIYYSTEELSMSEDTKIIVPFESLTCTGIIKLPKGVVELRFDPVEGYGCVIDKLFINSNVGQLKYKVNNGFCLSSSIIFFNEDPQITINVNDKEVDWLEISSVVELFVNGDNYSIIKKLQSIEEEVIESNTRMKNELQAVTDSYETTKNELQAVTNSYSWKITRPLRLVYRCLSKRK